MPDHYPTWRPELGALTAEFVHCVPNSQQNLHSSRTRTITTPDYVHFLVSGACNMHQSETLKSCPLCGGEPYDKGYGISCVKCGLWLGNGTQAIEHGGYKKLWNSRPSEDNDEHPHL